MLVRFLGFGLSLLAITIGVGIAIATAYTASAEAGAANYNARPGDDFMVYYSFEAPGSVAPCHEARPGIGGWVCR